MIALGVTFLVAIVLLGIYGLRLRATRLKQAEHGIARLEDALRETDAAIGRVESEIAVVTDAVKASLIPRERAKPGPKAAPSTPLREALLNWHPGHGLGHYLAAVLADACRFSRLSDRELLEAEPLRDLLLWRTCEPEGRKSLLLLSKETPDWTHVYLLNLALTAPSAGALLEAWQCDVPGSALGIAKTPKGRRPVLLRHGERGY